MVILGWHFDKSEEPFPGCTRDPVLDADFLRELYLKSDPSYKARFTVPVLWDKKLSTIVNNESADIVQMLNSSFNEFAEHPSLNLRPQDLIERIDSANQWIYDGLNNGVYKAGFATSQESCIRINCTSPSFRCAQCQTCARMPLEGGGDPQGLCLFSR